MQDLIRISQACSKASFSMASIALAEETADMLLQESSKDAAGHMGSIASSPPEPIVRSQSVVLWGSWVIS